MLCRNLARTHVHGALALLLGLGSVGLLAACASEQTTETNATTSEGGGSGQGGSGGQGCVPGAETCNGKDDNCDGQVDEGCDCTTGETQDCYSGPDGTDGVGLCKKGTQTCGSDGKWGTACAGEVVPKDEICNGDDDDCNATADDLPDVSCGVGAWAVTVAACDNGQPADCIPLAPSLEICDGIDNDCDQETDESFPDEGAVCDTGVSGICAAGTKACVAAAETCVPDNVALNESCNGLDDDCDGTVDNNVPGTGGACTTGLLGECAAGVIDCQNASVDCYPITPATPELCDGLDNDCDGQVDQGDPEGGSACSTGQQGACAQGTEHCVGGAIGCVPDAQSQTELCNGVDDDCDGTIDDGNPQGGGGCSCGGTLNCVGGNLLCQGCTKEFVCNDGVDDDGDGLVDCADPQCAFACALATPCQAGQKLINAASTDVPKPLPDVQTTTSTLPIVYAGTVQRAVVRINLNHTWDGDLSISIQGTSTPSVDLSTNNGGSSDNYINTVFDAACATPITAGSAPFTGCFSPEGPIASLSGTPVSQTWTLKIIDGAGGDSGTLNAWDMAFCVSNP